MSVELAPVPKWEGNRNIIVPPDIVPVRRISPIPIRKRTVCRHRLEGEPIVRAGHREWFGDHLFADEHPADVRAACSSSFTVHASCLLGLLLVLARPSAPLNDPVRVERPLQMPAFIALMNAGDDGSSTRYGGQKPSAASPPRVEAVPRVTKRPAALPKPETPPPAAAVVHTPLVDPPREVEADVFASVEEELPAGEHLSATADDSGDGAAGGAAGGGKGGNGSGDGSGKGKGNGEGSSGPGMSAGPYRLGQGIEPPRKIKDVVPIYPAGAMTSRALGTVVVEAIVGTDGKVHEPKIVHSIPSLDQAALDAVRQWEFVPSRLNGVPVAVIVTILVQFAIH